MVRVKDQVASYSSRRSKLLRETHKRLAKLPVNKLVLVNDLLVYIESSASRKATDELLNIPGFYDQFLKAKEEIRQGLSVSFDRIRRSA